MTRSPPSLLSPRPSALSPLVFITGASSGIGQALAACYLEAGWRLALSARREEALTGWIDQLGLSPDQAQAFPADARDTAAMAAAGRLCVERMGLPDAVIACAGVSVGFDTAEFDDLESMRAIFETNNIGMAATFQPFVALMRARGSGRLVGVASVAAYRGLPGHGAYCASKAASLAYCESLRSECAASGVKVVALAPGYIDTPLTRGNPYPMPFLMSAPNFADQAFKAIERGRPLSVIPWQMGWVATLLKALPNALFDRAFNARARKPRAKGPR